MEEDQLKSIFKTYLGPDSVPPFEGMWAQAASRVASKRWKRLGIAASILLVAAVLVVINMRPALVHQTEANIANWQTPSDVLMGDADLSDLTEWKSPTHSLMSGIQITLVNPNKHDTKNNR